METTRIIRLSEVMGRTGLSRSSIYLKVAEGTFPPQVALGSRAVGWVESEISTWLEERIAASRSSTREGA